MQFESLTQSLLRLPQVIQSIPDIIRNPAANPLQAAILLGIALVIALIVLFSVLLVILRPSPEDEEEFYAEEYEGQTPPPIAPETPSARPLSWLTVVSVIVLTVAVVWVTAGITTASSDVCTSCHTDTAHNVATVGSDPHAHVGCVSCHETGGVVARATVNLGTRVQHVLFARTGSSWATAYGRPVASDACLRCHHTQIVGVFHNQAQGVRVSHKEPLAAGAQCVDCHVLKGGVVGAQTVGMSPCLRCHNGSTAKADCIQCHDGDPAVAIRSSVASGAMAAAQVPNPQCTGCHFDMTKCNACHGISMPHSTVFKAYAHARQGALDIWFNNGKLCVKCHYAGHNSCLQLGCHSFPIAGGHPNPVWAKMHAITSWSQASVRCACHAWNPFDHNGMIYCQICHATKPKNALP